jgi:hypothetical protein
LSLSRIKSGFLGCPARDIIIILSYTVFSVGSVLRNYKRAQSGELKEYKGVQLEVQWSVQSEEDDSVSDSDL